MKYCTTSLLVSLGSLAVISTASPLGKRQNGTMVYDFADLTDQVTPSADLQWTPCFDNFTCALLTVPLDYEDPTAGTTNIAFAKQWSQNTSAVDVLYNPGGPGGSGIAVALAGLTDLDRLGDGYNIVGFDPRGVNNSGPSLDCFPGQPVAENALSLDVLIAALDANSTELPEVHQRSAAWARWCTAVHRGNGGVARYANTPAVARDMLQYVEVRAKALGKPVEEAKLYYYGASYGTVLGQTFAALYPDRIGRMVLDGVMEGEDYYKGEWKTNLVDADAAARAFFDLCFEAGPERCAFHANASSADELEQRYLKMLADITKTPIPIADPALFNKPFALTWADVNIFWNIVLSNAVTYFPVAAQVLSEWEQGNATLLAQTSLVKNMRDPPCGQLPPDEYTTYQQRTQIACLDSNHRFNASDLDVLREYVDFQVRQSAYNGASWSSVVAPGCWALDISPPDSQVFRDVVPRADETSAPILFIGNTLDPRTPLRSAEKVAALFVGSGVLVQDTIGHASVAVPSKCTDGHFRAYFDDGALPPPGTVCPADVQPFEGSGDEVGLARRRVTGFGL